VIAAWRFGGPGEEKVPGLAGKQTSTRTHAARATLVVRAVHGGSWMEVRAGSTAGRLLYSGTLEAGQQKRFQSTQLQLSLSEPDNLAVRLNGSRVELPAGTAFVVTSRKIVRASS
jgi:hypothetical protein